MEQIENQEVADINYLEKEATDKREDILKKIFKKLEKYIDENPKRVFL